MTEKPLVQITESESDKPGGVPGASILEDSDILEGLGIATVPDRRRMLEAARQTLALDDRKLSNTCAPADFDATRVRIRTLRLLLGRMKRVLDIYEEMYEQQPLLAFLLMPGINAMLAFSGKEKNLVTDAAAKKAMGDCAHYLRQGVPLSRELGAAMRRLCSDPCYLGLLANVQIAVTRKTTNPMDNPKDLSKKVDFYIIPESDGQIRDNEATREGYSSTLDQKLAKI